MPDIKDIDEAKSITIQFYSNAKDPALTDLLEASKSDNSYRPYAVAAYFMLTEYRRIKKADEVTFEYDLQYTIEGLLKMQLARDCNDTTIDECWLASTLLDQLQKDLFSHPSAFVL